jgi:DHA1 family tetracycline resistance protein-like MFS transporter
MVDVFHMDVSTESEYIAWVSVPIIFANLGLTGILSSKYSLKTMTITSALLTGIFMIVIIIPNQPQYLWLTLFLAAITLAITLPSCATLLSVSANSDEQGRVMGNNQALQVGAEAISGLLGGIAAAILIELSLIVPGIIAIIAAIILFKAKTAPIQDN